MTRLNKDRTFLYFTFALISLIIVTSVSGIMMGNIYRYETSGWRIQSIGQDLTDLFILTPILLFSGISAYQGEPRGLYVFTAGVLFTAYTYTIYCFDIYFNSLFVFYCLTLGLSVYAFLYCIIHLYKLPVKEWFSIKTQVFPAGFFLLIVALVFYFLWLKEIIPAVTREEMPAGIAELELKTNPVHVLDLALILPAFIFSSVMWMRKKLSGYITVPVMLGFCMLISINIIIVSTVMKIRDTDYNLSLLYIIGGVAVLSSLLLYRTFGYLKKNL